MTKLLDPIKPDYDKAWVRGWGHINQEGTTYWRELREQRGWSREDIELLTDGCVPPPVQEMFEDYPTMPSREDLEALAIVYSSTPGRLLDSCYEAKGAELLTEEAQESG